ncbi:hypothetical protein [Microbacterium sp. 2FI]|uniref:hypothetical protein n=1 Tax=Microbacterium sp. 2FI TaxID=2502193 RepID=UPI0010F97910|nr:hypothetical protein [Microbacterium sp. 2FI]
MLSLVTAAEQQYRYDTAARDRELALLASIRERRLAEAMFAEAPVRLAPRAAWARPIGVRLERAEVCTTTCAIA